MHRSRTILTSLVAILGILALMVGMLPVTGEALAQQTKPAAEQPKGHRHGDPKKIADPKSKGAPGYQARGLKCYGTGTDGVRIQAIHVRKSGGNNTFVLSTARTELGEADSWFNANAQLSNNQTRHLRYVHNSSCQPIIPTVVLSSSVNLNNDIQVVDAMRALGYNASDRKYLLFVDSVHPDYCGVGDLWEDDSKVQSNLNNQGNMFAVAWSGCWDDVTLAHEMVHFLGGVQDSAPHSTLKGHCYDEKDFVCYNDGGAGWQNVADTCSVRVLDCGRDDFMRVSPDPGMYLYDYWNIAYNQYMGT